MNRQLVIAKPFLSEGRPGTVRTQESLGWSDDRFDRFVAAGNATELVVGQPAGVPSTHTTIEQVTNAQPDTPPLFDPSEHSVIEVNEYLEDADEDEVDRVLAAEAAGKARSGILT